MSKEMKQDLKWMLWDFLGAVLGCELIALYFLLQ